MYKRQIKDLVLWKNEISHAGAVAIAQYIGTSNAWRLCEVHLSHNHLDSAAVTELLSAAARARGDWCTPRYPLLDHGVTPLWLRLEHNALSKQVDDMQSFLSSMANVMKQIRVAEGFSDSAAGDDVTMLCVTGPERGICSSHACSRGFAYGGRIIAPVVHVPHILQQGGRIVDVMLSAQHHMLVCSNQI